LNLLNEIKNNNLVELFINGNFGLEKEGLRAESPANLATSMHPESLGNREVNPHIKTDYGESQPEIITPPLAPYSRAHDWLQTLSYVLMANLPEDEYMWPFSVPCQLPEDDRLINISQTSNPELEDIDYIRLPNTEKSAN
jgi:Gamma-glutamylcysteine synthetase